MNKGWILVKLFFRDLNFTKLWFSMGLEERERDESLTDSRVYQYVSMVSGRLVGT